jgi:16S rRNA (guanine527-N7)-methyltransferase
MRLAPPAPSWLPDLAMLSSEKPIDSAPPVSAHCIGAHARDMGVELSADQCEQLERFASLLLRWNRTYNLTAITDSEQVLTHHLLDSLSLVGELPATRPLRILDAGAGAGLPGIPLAIALPGHQFVLVDAVAKKCAFTTQAHLELGLANVDVVHSRLEELHGPRFDARFDVIVSRALGSLAMFVSISRHLLSPNGRWLAMKGQLPEHELRDLPPDVTASRWARIHVPHLSEVRHLVVLQSAHHPS